MKDINMKHEIGHGDDTQEVTLVEAEVAIQEPHLYQVVMHNDDFTPMEFVVAVLEIFFNMDRTKATSVMYEVHISGKAVCGVYTRDVAETKADQVVEYA